MSKFKGYNYRKRHFITGSVDGTQTNYQVMFKVSMDRGADSGQNIYLNGHSLSSLLDVRFYNQSGTKLDYWIETSAADIVTNRWAYIWVEIDSIPTTGCLIDIVYGRVNDAGESNGDNTFLLFDHFDGASLDTGKWTSNGTSLSVSNSEVVATNSNGNMGGIYSNAAFGSNTAFYVRWKPSIANTNYPLFGYDNRVVSGTGYALIVSQGGVAPSTAGWHTENYNTSYDGDSFTDSPLTTQYYNSSIIRNGTTNVIYTVGSFSSHTHSTQTPTMSMRVMIGGWVGQSTADFALVRKYTANEPAHSDYGNEEGDYPTSYTGWNYRKRVDIGNASGAALTGYQMMLTVNRSEGVSSGAAVYVGTRCSSTFSDLRFTDQYGNSCPYWIESITGTASAVVWVRMPAIPTTGTYVYLYYGQPGATNNSDGNATFDFFDDFSANLAMASNPKWTRTIPNGSSSVAGGVASFTGTSGNSEGWKGTTSVGYPFAARMRGYISTDITYFDFGVCYDGVNKIVLNHDNASASVYNVAAFNNSSGSLITRTALTSNCIVDLLCASTSSAQCLIDGVSQGTLTTNLPTGNQAIYMVAWGTHTIYLDFALLRKYTATEPTFAHWYPDEQNVQKFHRSQMLNRIQGVN